MKKIIISFALMVSVLFASQIMAQESPVIFSADEYMIVATTDLVDFAEEVASILDWTGTTAGVDRWYPLGKMRISTDPITDDPLYVQAFTLFRDQACPQ